MLDALAAVIVANDYLYGTAVPATCDLDGRQHDGSTIWLPAVTEK